MNTVQTLMRLRAKGWARRSSYIMKRFEFHDSPAKFQHELLFPSHKQALSFSQTSSFLLTKKLFPSHKQKLKVLTSRVPAWSRTYFPTMPLGS